MCHRLSATCSRFIGVCDWLSNGAVVSAVTYRSASSWLLAIAYRLFFSKASEACVPILGFGATKIAAGGRVWRRPSAMRHDDEMDCRQLREAGKPKRHTRPPAAISFCLPPGGASGKIFRLDERLAPGCVHELGANSDVVRTLPLGRFVSWNRLSGRRLDGRVF